MQTNILIAAAAALVIAIGVILLQRFLLKRQVDTIQQLRRYDALLDVVIMELRDTWDHLPRFIPMGDKWSRLASEIGFALPKLVRHTRLTGRDPVGSPLTTDEYAMSWFQDVDGLVIELNDPKLTELWSSRRLPDLVEILRLALFKTWQPGFDLSPLYTEPKG